jgi:hypothetical protein
MNYNFGKGKLRIWLILPIFCINYFSENNLCGQRIIGHNEKNKFYLCRIT